MTSPYARELISKRPLEPRWSECRFFDLSDVSEMLRPVAEKLNDPDACIGELCLPSRKIWIEWIMLDYDTKKRTPYRQGVLLERLSSDEKGLCDRIAVDEPWFDRDDGWRLKWGFPSLGRGEFLLSDFRKAFKPDVALENRKRFCECLRGAERNVDHLKEIIGALILINSRRGIERVERNPRQFRRRYQTKIGGGFPLHAYTEIKFSLSKKQQCELRLDANASGRKCQHFVLAYTRIRLGKLEFVREHWKGDPSKGMKQSRYAIVY